MKGETTVDLDGINLIVEFEVSGRYIPATHDQPAEYADIDVRSVKVEDSDISIHDLLSYEQIDRITEQIRENLED